MPRTDGTIADRMTNADDHPDSSNMGPYGPRGEDTPPLRSMMAGYGIIFLAVILLPLLLFVLVRFVLL